MAGLNLIRSSRFNFQEPVKVSNARAVKKGERNGATIVATSAIQRASTTAQPKDEPVRDAVHPTTTLDAAWKFLPTALLVSNSRTKRMPLNNCAPNWTSWWHGGKKRIPQHHSLTTKERCTRGSSSRREENRYFCWSSMWHAYVFYIPACDYLSEIMCKTQERERCSVRTNGNNLQSHSDADDNINVGSHQYIER